MVFNDLDRRRAKAGYVKTDDGLEVDFLARYPGGQQEFIQVCAAPPYSAAEAPELRALAAAEEEHPRVRPLVLVLDWAEASHMKGVQDFEVLPAYEWLLAR